MPEKLKVVNYDNERQKADEWYLLDEWGSIIVLWEYDTRPTNYEETNHVTVRQVRMIVLLPDPNYPDKDAYNITELYGHYTHT